MQIIVQLVRLRRYRHAVEAGFVPQLEPLRENDVLADGVESSAPSARGEVKVATAVPTSLTNSHRRFFHWRTTPLHAKIFLILFFALCLATLGVCGWGLGESVKSTRTQISTFWDIVDDVQGRIEVVVTDLHNVETTIQSAVPGIEVVSSLSAQSIIALSEAAGQALTDSEVSTVQTVLGQVTSAAPRALQQIDTVANMLQDDILDTISDIEDDARPVTMKIQNTYRYIVFAVIFGVSMLVVLLLMVLLPTMRYYKTAAFVVAVSWIFTALLMFFGVSLLHGTYEFSNDACLYAETYVYNRAMDGIDDSNERAMFRRAFWYYTGTVDYSNTTFFDNITDSSVGMQQIIYTLEQEPFPTLLEVLNSVPEETVASLIGADEAASIAALPNAVIQLLGNATSALSMMQSASITPLLHRAKRLICCDISNSVHNTWVAWTVSASLLFVICIFGTARVISHTIVAARHIRNVLNRFSSTDSKNASDGSEDADFARAGDPAGPLAYGGDVKHAYGDGAFSRNDGPIGGGVSVATPPTGQADAYARALGDLPASYGAQYASEGKPIDASSVDSVPPNGNSNYYYPPQGQWPAAVSAPKVAPGAPIATKDEPQQVELAGHAHYGQESYERPGGNSAPVYPDNASADKFYPVEETATNPWSSFGDQPAKPF